MASRLMTAVEVSQRTRMPLETLRYRRWKGLPPRSFKLGRRVLYEEADVETWIAGARETGDAA